MRFTNKQLRQLIIPLIIGQILTVTVGFAILTVASQCIGAGDYVQAKYYTKKLVKITFGAMIVVNLVIYIMLPFILHIYNLSPETEKMTREILTWHAICCCTIWPFSFSLPNTLRASNDVKFTMWISIFSMWIFRIGFSYLLGQYLEMGVLGIWIAMFIDWGFRAICFGVRYWRGKWKLKEL